MSKSVQIFEHDEFGRHAVRLDEQGNAVFMLEPVTKALGYTRGRNAARFLDRDEYWTEAVDLPAPDSSSSQVRRRVLVISESGLYHLVFASGKEEAKRFRRWVTEELLPTIRRAHEVGIDVVEDLKEQIARKQDEYNDLLTDHQALQIDHEDASTKLNKKLAAAYREGVKTGRSTSRTDVSVRNPYDKRRDKLGTKSQTVFHYKNM